MTENLLFGLSALVALVPVSVLSWRPDRQRNVIFWLLLAVAVIGPGVWALAQMSGSWRTGLSITLWVTVAASMGLFAAVAALTREGWRLAPLVAPYMFVVGVLALIWQHAPGGELEMAAPTAWVHLHILLSVTTYGLVTLAAVAAFAAFLQERALKSKHPSSLTRLLPSVADCETLLVRLLVIGEAVLAFGLATGAAINYFGSGTLLAFDHKTVLSITTFVIIGGLLFAHFRSGVRGRLVTRFVLLAYLLLTLGYPGVKFVSEVILG